MNFRLLNRGWISEARASRLVDGSITLLVFANVYWVGHCLPGHRIVMDVVLTAVMGLLGLQDELLYHVRSSAAVTSPRSFWLGYPSYYALCMMCGLLLLIDLGRWILS